MLDFRPVIALGTADVPIPARQIGYSDLDMAGLH